MEGFNSSRAIYDLLSTEICHKRNRLYKFTWVFVCFVFLLITGKPMTRKASRYLFHSFHLPNVCQSQFFPLFLFLLFDNVMEHVTSVVGSQVSASVITNSSAPQVFSTQPIVSSVLLDQTSWQPIIYSLKSVHCGACLTAFLLLLLGEASGTCPSSLLLQLNMCTCQGMGYFCDGSFRKTGKSGQCKA